MAQKRKLNRGLEALLGTGLLAKGQDDTQSAQAPAAEQRALTLQRSYRSSGCKEVLTSPVASLTRRR